MDTRGGARLFPREIEGCPAGTPRCSTRRPRHPRPPARGPGLRLHRAEGEGKHDLREIGGRLRDQVMFGAGCPLLGYKRLVGDWRNVGYEDDVLEKVFHRNAEAFLAGLGRWRGFRARSPHRHRQRGEPGNRPCDRPHPRRGRRAGGRDGAARARARRSGARARRRDRGRSRRGAGRRPPRGGLPSHRRRDRGPVRGRRHPRQQRWRAAPRLLHRLRRPRLEPGGRSEPHERRALHSRRRSPHEGPRCGQHRQHHGAVGDPADPGLRPLGRHPGRRHLAVGR